MSIQVIDALIAQKRFTEAQEELLKCEWTSSVELMKRKAFILKNTADTSDYLTALESMANLSTNVLDKEFLISELISNKQFDRAYQQKCQLMKQDSYLESANQLLAKNNQLFVNSFMFFRAYTFEKLKESCLSFIDGLRVETQAIDNRMRLFVNSLHNRSLYRQQYHPEQLATFIYYPELENKSQYSIDEVISKNLTKLDISNIASLARVIQSDNQKPYVAELEQTPPEFDNLKGTLDWSAVKLQVGEDVLNQSAESLKIIETVNNCFDLADFPPMAPEVMISLLKPNTEIRPHHGITNLKLTVHIPIDIPAGDLGLNVVNDYYHWEPGSVFIFDDTYKHQAWNKTQKVRSVLIFDIWNPQLLAVERQLIKFTVNKLQKWNESLYLLNKPV
jgi:hypothetical protein